jgi:hypothetical protein
VASVADRGTFSVLQGAATLRDLGPGGSPTAPLAPPPWSPSTAAASCTIPRAELEALLDEPSELSRGVIRTLLGLLSDSDVP